MRATRSALLWITKILETQKISYRISGGFAANLYGSPRELADIDIDIRYKDFSKILPLVKKYIVYGPAQYKDSHWNLPLMTLRYRNQHIDICGGDKTFIFNNKRKDWERLKTDFKTVTYLEYAGIRLSVCKLKDLISYKRKLDRLVDRKDIQFFT